MDLDSGMSREFWRGDFKASDDIMKQISDKSSG